MASVSVGTGFPAAGPDAQGKVAGHGKDVALGYDLQVVRRSHRLFDVLAEEGTVHMSVKKTAVSFGPFGKSEWQLHDTQCKDSSPILVKRPSLATAVTFESTDGDVLTCMSHKWHCYSKGRFNWHSVMYRWELVWFSMPVTLHLIEEVTGKKVASLQGYWDVPCVQTKGHWNFRDHITILEGTHDSTWLRLVVASGMKEADRRRRNRYMRRVL